jgi:hypothetical protein
VAEVIVAEIDDYAHPPPLQSGDKSTRAGVNQLGHNRNICLHQLSCALGVTQMIVSEHADLNVETKAS